uniref:hypothetical protein n=1 Tax=Micrococcus sp. HSID17228 TaxID=2419507 RepID=UPI00352AA8BE
GDDIVYVDARLFCTAHPPHPAAASRAHPVRPPPSALRAPAAAPDLAEAVHRGEAARLPPARQPGAASSAPCPRLAP